MLILIFENNELLDFASCKEIQTQLLNISFKKYRNIIFITITSGYNIYKWI